MALVACEDCSREVSTKAAACPHCGCPVPGDADSRAAAGTASVPPPIPGPTVVPAGTGPLDVPVQSNRTVGIVVVSLILAAFAFLIVMNKVNHSDATTDRIATTDAAADAAAAAADAVAAANAAQEASGDAEAALTAQSAADAAAAAANAAADAVAAAQDAPVTSPADASPWMYDASSEGLSDKPVRRALVISSNTVNLDFPYAGAQHGRLQMRKHPRWGNDVIFSIERGQILCHAYGDCRVGVRFDDGKISRVTGTPPSDNSSETVFIPLYSTFLKQLKTAKRVRIEVQIYQGGSQVFDFDVSGFDADKFAKG